MDPESKHKNGVYYTPQALARHLLSRCPVKKPNLVFDPACGKFSLLLAAQEKYRLGDDCCIGCDKRRIGVTRVGFRYICSDFFKFRHDDLVDLIVTNPPYIKGDRCPSSCRRWYEKRAIEGVKIGRRADMWTYFLLKSIDHLSSGGTIAAILPWSFFQADYAKSIRAYLIGEFKKIDIQVLTAAHFDDTPQKVVLIWLYGKGCECSSIRYCCNDEILNTDEVDKSFESISRTDWIYGARVRGVSPSSGNEVGVSDFGTYCDVKIGLVPGATRFFIKTREQVRGLGITNRDYVKMITNGKSLTCMDASEIPREYVRYALRISTDNVTKFRSVIKEAEIIGLQTRAHCRKRKKWYSIDFPDTKPDAFFTYRTSSCPLLVLNDCNLECTNSVHRIFFREKKLSYNKKRWLQISLLSAYSLLDFEMKSRVYGANVLKIEPTALKSVKVYCPEEPVCRYVLDRINKALKDGDRISASKEATKYVFEAMKLSKKKQREILEKYNRLRSQRISNVYNLVCKKQ